jgi:hypothetical protein
MSGRWSTSACVLIYPPLAVLPGNRQGLLTQ